MDGASDELFTGSVLSKNQCGVGALSDLGKDTIELLHFRGAADDIA